MVCTTLSLYGSSSLFSSFPLSFGFLSLPISTPRISCPPDLRHEISITIGGEKQREGKMRMEGRRMRRSDSQSQPRAERKSYKTDQKKITFQILHCLLSFLLRPKKCQRSLLSNIQNKQRAKCSQLGLDLTLTDILPPPPPPQLNSARSECSGGEKLKLTDRERQPRRDETATEEHTRTFCSTYSSPRGCVKLVTVARGSHAAGFRKHPKEKFTLLRTVLYMNERTYESLRNIEVLKK